MNLLDAFWLQRAVWLHCPLTTSKGGLTHGFVAEFASTEDRDYYVTTDPVHQEFVKSVGGVVEKIAVVDFVDGVY